MGWAGGAVPLPEPRLTLSAEAPKSRAIGRDPKQVLSLTQGCVLRKYLGLLLGRQGNPPGYRPRTRVRQEESAGEQGPFLGKWENDAN